MARPLAQAELRVMDVPQLVKYCKQQGFHKETLHWLTEHNVDGKALIALCEDPRLFVLDMNNSIKRSGEKANLYQLALGKLPPTPEKKKHAGPMLLSHKRDLIKYVEEMKLNKNGRPRWDHSKLPESLRSFSNQRLGRCWASMLPRDYQNKSLVDKLTAARKAIAREERYAKEDSDDDDDDDDEEEEEKAVREDKGKKRLTPPGSPRNSRRSNHQENDGAMTNKKLRFQEQQVGAAQQQQSTFAPGLPLQAPETPRAVPVPSTLGAPIPQQFETQQFLIPILESPQQSKHEATKLKTPTTQPTMIHNSIEETLRKSHEPLLAQLIAVQQQRQKEK